MRPADRDGFRIAIICALTLEADAVESLFDETYDRLGQVYGKQPGDKNAYITGKIGQHNAVLCYLPGMGKTSAAGAAANLRVSFTGIQIALVVGVCGGVPFPSKYSEIILGDVIVSDSVIEYDFGRQFPDGFQRKSHIKDMLARPNQEVRALLVGLKGQKTGKELVARVRHHLEALQAQSSTTWRYPGIEHDILFEASYRHKHYQEHSADRCICFDSHSSDDPMCDEAVKQDCNSIGCAGKRVYRKRCGAANTDPSVYIGTIGSADTVLKCGERRDKMAQKEGIIAFEMEGAGVWDNVPCIVIKGVCDYADSHKNKKWQHYAAATAASGAKAVLKYWIPSSPEIPYITESKSSNMAILLKGYYNSSKRLEIHRISGEVLPMDQCYINLALMEASYSDTTKDARQSSPFPILARLKVYTVSKSMQVSLPTLFGLRKQQDGGSIRPGRILIRGRAGV